MLNMIRNPRASAASLVTLAFSVAVPVYGQNPDATLFTTYTLSSNDQFLSWVVCGSTQQSEGCYSSGNLGPFGKAGALMESDPVIAGNSVLRAIFVVDTASGSSGDGVKLFVYLKRDVVSPTYDTATVTLLGGLSLPLVGGPTAVCSMAANKGFLFIGTDLSPQAVKVELDNGSVTQLGGFVPPITVSAITADEYGYVTVTQGSFSSGTGGFSVFGPDGALREDGGGADFMLNTVTGVSTATLPHSSVQPASRLGYKLKAAGKPTDQGN